MSLSIIIPCFNEEKNIVSVLKYLLQTVKKYTHNYEIIVIDDSSQDKTSEKVKNFQKKEKNIYLFRNKLNLGYGGSFKEGLKRCKKKYVVTATGDGETNFNILFKYFNYTKKFSIVCTYPVGNDRGVLRNFLSSFFTKILNFFFNLNLKYYNGATFYELKKLKKVFIGSNGFFFNAEILIKLIKIENIKFIEKPIMMKTRFKGKSNAIKLSVLFHVIIDFIKTRILI